MRTRKIPVKYWTLIVVAVWVAILSVYAITAHAQDKPKETPVVKPETVTMERADLLELRDQLSRRDLLRKDMQILSAQIELMKPDEKAASEKAQATLQEMVKKYKVNAEEYNLDLEKGTFTKKPKQ